MRLIIIIIGMLFIVSVWANERAQAGSIQVYGWHGVTTNLEKQYFENGKQLLNTKSIDYIGKPVILEYQSSAKDKLPKPEDHRSFKQGEIWINNQKISISYSLNVWEQLYCGSDTCSGQIFGIVQGIDKNNIFITIYNCVILAAE